MTHQDEATHVPITRRMVFHIGLAIVGLWLLTPAVAYWITWGDWGRLGQSGDVFGSINALFSGFAFAGVIVAILLQREELALQRQELRHTRAEMKRTADAQELAQKALNETLWAQNFKVVLDIIEAPTVVRARGVLYRRRAEFRKERREWAQEMLDSSETVARSFEGAATIIKNKLLPIGYMSPWTKPACRCWDIIGPNLLKLRQERNDPFLARDFEWFAQQLRQSDSSPDPEPPS
jgi:hypothetical protein